MSSDKHTHNIAPDPGNISLATQGGVAVYDWPHNDSVPRDADRVTRDGVLIGHADAVEWIQPTEKLPVFGGAQKVIPSTTEPPVLVLSNWTPMRPEPMNLNPGPTVSGINTDLYRAIYALVKMFGGAVHIDSKQWTEAEPDRVVLNVIQDPWMMQVKIPEGA